MEASAGKSGLPFAEEEPAWVPSMMCWKFRCPNDRNGLINTNNLDQISVRFEELVLRYLKIWFSFSIVFLVGRFRSPHQRRLCQSRWEKGAIPCSFLVPSLATSHLEAQMTNVTVGFQEHSDIMTRGVRVGGRLSWLTSWFVGGYLK